MSSRPQSLSRGLGAMNRRLLSSLYLAGLALVLPGAAMAQSGPQQRVDVEVAADILTSYVGLYQFASGLYIVVTLENGFLFTQIPGQERFRIFPESETEFFVRAFDGQVVFERSADGVVTGAVFTTGGQVMPARKIA
ncbi:MAG: DUF3471 domain-containing protein [Gemmatimonadetes bacterium]|nr:DUF3471 domain-containing protein [Gemmatimonadota bacterium]